MALAVITALLARREVPLGTLTVALAGVTSALMAGGALCARIGEGRRGLATALLFVSGGLGVLTAWTAADAYGWPGSARLAAVATAVALGLLLLGFFSPLGRGGLIGAGATTVLAAVWEAVAALEPDPARLGAVMAVFSVVLLGVLPRLALMSSGLTALDDSRSGGVSVSRHDVADALAATHRGLALATVATAVSATAASAGSSRSPHSRPSGRYFSPRWWRWCCCHEHGPSRWSPRWWCCSPRRRCCSCGW